MDNKVDQLEYTVMELGTEIFRLKSQISEITNLQEGMSKTLKNLKDILDEKGIVNEDDFDAATAALTQGNEVEDQEHMELAWNPVQNKPEFH